MAEKIKYNIIFTDGYDDLEVRTSEITGCVLIQDNLGQYYGPRFITLDRLKAVIKWKIKRAGGEDYMQGTWAEDDPVILLDISQEGIIKAVRELHQKRFWEHWKPLSQKVLENYFPQNLWTIHELTID
jgi:hypothetical protein